MNRKTSVRRAGKRIFIFQILAIIVLFITVVCFIDTHYARQRDPRYLRLEALAFDVTATKRNLVISLDETSEDSIGVSPEAEQERANEAFEKLSSAAEATPKEFVPWDVSLMLKDGPLKRVTLPKRQSVDQSIRAGVQ
ncbi:MAG: hypothetical protein WCO09_02785 [bacterium]